MEIDIICGLILHLSLASHKLLRITQVQWWISKIVNINKHNSLLLIDTFINLMIDQWMNYIWINSKYRSNLMRDLGKQQIRNIYWKIKATILLINSNITN